jgi:hypothetical protein
MICGRHCSITIDGGSSFEGYSYVIATNAPEEDVRAFGSGEYGAWLACAKNGTVTVNTYLYPGVEAGDTVNIVAVIGTPPVLTVTMNSCIVTTWDCNVDAKGIVYHTVNARITGDPTFVTA